MSSSARGLNPWGSNNGFVADYKLCGTNSFQAHDLLQHCESKGDDYHKATAFYLRTLFGALRKKVQCQLRMYLPLCQKVKILA
jgi:hypothetical protein